MSGKGFVPTFRELVMLGGVLLSAGMGWGMMVARVSAQEKKVAALAPVPEQLAILNERVDSYGKQAQETNRLLREIIRLLPKNR